MDASGNSSLMNSSSANIWRQLFVGSVEVLHSVQQCESVDRSVLCDDIDRTYLQRLIYFSNMVERSVQMSPLCIKLSQNAQCYVRDAGIKEVQYHPYLFRTGRFVKIAVTVAEITWFQMLSTESTTLLT